MSKRAQLVFSLTLLGAALGCQHAPELEPAAGAAQPRGMDDAVTQTQRAVRVTMHPEWPGEAAIERAVTPVRVIIENGSDRELQFRYSDFAIEAAAVKYRALPPRKIGDVVETRVPAPMFTHRGFYTAPYYGAEYHEVQPFHGPFMYDAPYYGEYYSYWAEYAPLPTPEMIARALPEGVIAPGGRVDGYIYFQKVHLDRGTDVALRASLKPVGGDAPYVSFELPFVFD